VTRDSSSDRLLLNGEEAGTAPEDRKYRPDAEGLRAVAILLVVLFHVGFHQWRGGYVGVDVFFVISGFVITGLLLRERTSSGRTGFLAFYARRARRILPAALIVIMVTLIATRLLLGSRDAVLTASDSRWSALFLGNFHFASVTPSVLFIRYAPLQHLWSLSVEEQFYLFYPAFFALLLIGHGGRDFRKRLTLGLAAIVAISFVLAVVSSKNGATGPYVSPFNRAWEFAVGALVAVGTTQLKRLPGGLAAAITWVGAFCIIFAATTLPITPGYKIAVPVVGAGLIIAGGTSIPAWGIESLLRLPPLQWIGRLSYSWYLWHWPVLAIATEYALMRGKTLSILDRVILVLGSLLIATASYYLVENPVRHSRLLVKSPTATMVGAALLVASCVGFTYVF
jgi:peptidoglycan/LPS O-acetylase OafA/YrhL